MQRFLKLALVPVVIIIAFAAVQHAYETYNPAASWQDGETVIAGGVQITLNDIPVRVFVNPSNQDGLSVDDVMGAMQVGSFVWNNANFGFDPPIQLPGIDPDSQLPVAAISAVAFDDNIDGDGDWRTNRCCNAVMFRNSISGRTIAVTSTWVLTEDPTVILASDQVYYTRRWDYVPYSYTDQSTDGSGVPAPCSNDFYLDGIRAHEAGHSIGLAHSEVQAATMYASASTCDEDIVSLHPDDLDGRDFLYGAGDVTDIAITDVSAPSSALQGDDVVIDVTVENVGTQDVTSEITVRVNDDPDGWYLEQAIADGLTAGEATTLQFTWDTAGASVVKHTLTASHNTSDSNDTNDSDSTEVDIQTAVTDIAITGVSVPLPVVEGDSVTVSVTAENVGNQNVTDTITVSLNDDDGTGPTLVSSHDIVGGLSASTFTVVEFAWTAATAGSHTLAASHDFADDDASNDSDNTMVDVQPADTDIAVTAVSAPGSATQGDLVSVDVTVQNEGNQDVTDTITMSLTDGVTPIGTDDIVGGLSAGASTTVTFSWDTSLASPGDHTLNASHSFGDDDATNDSGSTVVTINEGGVIELTANIPNGRFRVQLAWTGATGSEVDIKKNGVVTTTANDGSYQDRDVSSSGTYVYEVCETGSSNCSNPVTVENGEVVP
jgi:hypothetical protein